ncbi:MAG: HK97 family phage prohead protease [Caenibius sp.]
MSGEQHPMRIAGYAALFDIADGAGDTIRKGAFSRTLERHKSPVVTPVPLYWQHRPDQRIGWVEEASEDERGLRIIARIDNPHGRAAAALTRREISGLSFGYRARGYRRLTNGRLLEEIDLIEVSLVTHPLQPGARVHLLA